MVYPRIMALVDYTANIVSQKADQRLNAHVRVDVDLRLRRGGSAMCKCRCRPATMVSVFLHYLGSTAVVFHEPAVLYPQQDPCVTPIAEWEPQVVLQGAFAADAALSSRLSRLQVYLCEQAADFASAPWHLYCRPLRDQAYLTQWRDFFQPIAIENRLRVRPPWDESPIPNSMACLTLEPGMAFGTGTHPTTRLALSLLARYVSRAPPGRLLDVGCGSGILSLGALQLGAQALSASIWRAKL